MSESNESRAPAEHRAGESRAAEPGRAAANDGAAEHTERGARAMLSSRDRSILDFEREWQRKPEAKSDAVQSKFGLSFARYYQVLNGIIDSPAALAYDPMLVRRLQRVRDARTSARTLQHPHTTTPSRLS